jgi:hypothetical protein
MKITITNNTKLKDIKSIFHKEFDGLKIYFFVDKNMDGNYTADEKLSNFETKFKDIAAIKNDGEIVLNELTSVKELEDAFQSKFGIVAQVFRKSGNTWLMTTETDNYSLDVLNKMANESTQASHTSDIIDAQDRGDLE